MSAASTKLKMATLAAMPRVRMTMAVRAKPGFFRSWRRAKRRSWEKDSAADSQPADQTLWRTVSALPTSARAARRACSRDMPRRILSSTEASRKVCSSAWISALRWLRRKRARIPPMRFPNMTNILLSGFENAVDGGGLAAPLLAFFAEGFAAAFGEHVIAGAAIVFRGAPLAFDAAGALHAAERGQKRAGIDAENAAADLLDAESDAVAVHGLEVEGLEDQHFQGPLNKVAGGIGHRWRLLQIIK